MTTPDSRNSDARNNYGGVRALDSKAIAGAAMLVMLLFILSRGTGLLREMIIGARFGTAADLDAYLAAFRIPDLLFQLVAGGALGSAFIPTFAAAWTEDGQQQAWLLFSRVLNLLTLFLVLLCGLAMLFAEPLVAGVIAPGFPVEQQKLTASLMRWMLASTVVFGASGLIMGALNAVQHFLLPAVAPVLYNCAIITGAWLLAPVMGIHGLVIGVAAGAVLHLLVQLPALLRQKVRYRFSFRIGDAQVREVARLMGPRVLGLLFVQLNFLVNTILASGLPDGSLSALNYAWLLMLLPQGIFAQAVATVAFPTFSAQVASGNRAQLLETLSRLLRLVLFLSIPAAFLLYVLDEPFIELLFQRGRFDVASTQAVAYALRFYALGLVAHAVVEIVVRVFYALHDTATPVVAGVATMALNILLSLALIGRLSFGGLALANSIATALEMLVLLIQLARKVRAPNQEPGHTTTLQGLPVRQLLQSGARSLLASAIMAGALLFGLELLPAGNAVFGIPAGWVAAVAGAGLGVLIYALASYLLGGAEIRQLAALARRRAQT
ncbi:MAG: murein biosynthesis integral membrane protein MurJ [Caldilineaceae bacterium SB0670_bin_27]|uniref:Probable lipid II flippase MurJ n=1 Tax=Caldilineaceae bacterium SB0664_bin_27 TaxID=2605260 RepID=A0A6B0YQE4_9CHLR|nr:murein biosynthesis integral membrane protein MurJ [Caldilineaceae bacterium SB0664_bin_27]MYJ78193.1 murein biosynthesis integral membrane protein MurJ [Caldilineaceae bacterium SB0670_bin_27]